jgi:hypothetical protein
VRRRGTWIDENTFVGHIQTLGNDDAREVILTFEGTGVDLSVEDADGSMTLLHGETKG